MGIRTSLDFYRDDLIAIWPDKVNLGLGAFFLAIPVELLFKEMLI